MVRKFEEWGWLLLGILLRFDNFILLRWLRVIQFLLMLWFFISWFVTIFVHSLLWLIPFLAQLLLYLEFLLLNLFQLLFFQNCVPILIGLHAVINKVNHLQINRNLLNGLCFISTLYLAIYALGLYYFGHSLSCEDAGLGYFDGELTLEVLDGLGSVFHFKQDGYAATDNLHVGIGEGRSSHWLHLALVLEVTHAEVVGLIVGKIEILLKIFFLHVKLSLSLLQLYLFCRLFWLSTHDLVWSPRYLLDIVKHRGVLHEITHEHPFVGVSHWEFYLVFAKLTVHYLESWKFIFHHHEGVSPKLYKIQQ